MTICSRGFAVLAGGAARDAGKLWLPPDPSGRASSGCSLGRRRIQEGGWRSSGGYAACGIAATMPLPGLCREYQEGLVQGSLNTGLLARQPFNMRHSP